MKKHHRNNNLLTVVRCPSVILARVVARNPISIPLIPRPATATTTTIGSRGKTHTITVGPVIMLIATISLGAEEEVGRTLNHVYM